MTNIGSLCYRLISTCEISRRYRQSLRDHMNKFNNKKTLLLPKVAMKLSKVVPELSNLTPESPVEVCKVLDQQDAVEKMAGASNDPEPMPVSLEGLGHGLGISEVSRVIP